MCSCRPDRKHIMTEGKHQCFTPQMESMLTEAECYCAKLSMAIFQAKCCHITVRTTPSQSAPKHTRNNLPTLQTCSNRSTCIYVHHGIQILPRGQRGIRIEQHASTVLRRQTAHGHTRTITRKPTGSGWSGGWSGPEQQLLENPTFLCISSEKVLNST